MMKLSNASKAILIAVQKGYTIDKEGGVWFRGRKKSLPCCNSTGYLYFGVRATINGKNQVCKIFVHRFQAYKKYGNKLFSPGIQSRHANGNVRDNHHRNILIGTASQNQMDVAPEVRISRAIHASSHRRSFSDEQVKAILQDKENGMGYKELSEKYQSSKGTLHYLINNSLYAQECNLEVSQ